MKLLLTSAGIKNASIHDALVDLLGKPIAESNALCIPTAGYGHPRAVLPGPWRFISGQSRLTHVRAGLEVRGRAGAHRAAQHRRGTLGPLGPGDRRPAGERRRRPVPVPLDAAVRAGGPPAVAARDGLGGAERREHGDDPPHRGGLRRVEAAHRWRRDAGRSSTSRSSRTWITRTCRRTPWPTQKDGRPASRVRRTRSTTRPPSRWSTAPSKSSPRGTGSCSALNAKRVQPGRGAIPARGSPARSSRLHESCGFAFAMERRCAYRPPVP